MAPSIVAGNPVAVQSPASTRLWARVVRVDGRLASWVAVAEIVARFSLTTRYGGIWFFRLAGSPRPSTTFGQTAEAMLWTGSSTRLLAALMVTETWFGFTNTHSAVPEVNPTKPAAPVDMLLSASIRKWMFRIAWKSSGTTRPGSKSCATHGGTASTI